MDFLLFIFIFLCGLCWGSFLNVVAYRIVNDKPFFTKRSYCTSCQHIIPWYYNIPIFSWILLKGKCCYCKNRISFVYPLIELLTAVVTLGLVVKFYNLSAIAFVIVFFVYWFFFNALILSTATDLRSMVIPQLFTLWLIPVGILFSFLGFISVTLLESVLGAIVGYGILWITGKIFMVSTKRDGIGVGDMELLGLIGAFLGPLGVWTSLMLGSIFGFVLGGASLLILKKGMRAKIPFGPFLAFGAMAYFFFQKAIFSFFIY